MRSGHVKTHRQHRHQLATQAIEPDTQLQKSLKLRAVARALIDGSEAAAQIVDEMVAMTEQILRQIDTQRPDPPAAELRARAAVTLAMALGIRVPDPHLPQHRHRHPFP